MGGKSIVVGTYIFTCLGQRVYVKHQWDVFVTPNLLGYPRVFVVFDRNCVSRLHEDNLQNDVDDTTWTFGTDMGTMDLKILEVLRARAHPSEGHQHGVFKLLYTSLYNVWIVRCKNSKLTRMHRKPNIQLSRKVTDWPEICFSQYALTSSLRQK